MKRGKSKMKLTSTQANFLPAILWLTDPTHMAEGKSTVLAYAFISHAINNLGRSIQIWDHIPGYPQLKIFVDRIRVVHHDLGLDKQYSLQYSIADGTIMMDRIKDNGSADSKE
jgi:hypothetical protein